ncbi:MAG: TauD/TfdA family dioxygenase [Actinobacteria bacterium]|nr:TauD/TfdA family dioxygenase [Actinomycetota bacterium]
MATTTVTPDGRTLALGWPDGREGRFHAAWLRDSCPCPECRHPSGQRLLDSVAIPDDVALASATAGNRAVDVVFTDGHEASFDDGWLGEQVAPPAPRPRRLWDAEIAQELPVERYEDVTAAGEALRRWLAAVDELGFGLLTGGPTEPGTVTRVAELFGYVRETNYGRLFDVRSVIDATNLAYTGLGLGPHTDNPYRDPTPTLQLLHCLSSSAGGGENTLVDGFRVGEELRSSDPAAFEVLARTPIRFRYSDGDTELEAERTVLELNERDELRAIHFNTRSAVPPRLEPEAAAAFYSAYRTFGRLLGSAEHVLQFKLEPGDLFIVDNERVLHGRTGYSEAGERHLQGCYADRDGLRSRLAVLSR